MNEVQAYPLHWPPGIARTPISKMQRARFSRRLTDHAYKNKEQLTLAQAKKRLHDELRRLGARDVVISTNVVLRLDGEPRSGQREPDDPGVAVYWTQGKERRCIPCDRWDRVPDNMAAVAAAIGALRGLDRWVNESVVSAAFTGFNALPSPQAFAEDWRAVFGLDPDEAVTAADIQELYRRAAMTAHPDRGGSEGAMARVNRARERALQEIGHG